MTANGGAAFHPSTIHREHVSSATPFRTRYRWRIILASVLTAVVLLVLGYRLTAPESQQVRDAAGARVAESEVLRVGALPVT